MSSTNWDLPRDYRQCRCPKKNKQPKYGCNGMQATNLGFFMAKHRALPASFASKIRSPSSQRSGTPAEWPKQQVLGLFALVAEDVDLKPAGEPTGDPGRQMGWGYTDKTHTRKCCML